MQWFGNAKREAEVSFNLLFRAHAAICDLQAQVKELESGRLNQQHEIYALIKKNADLRGQLEDSPEPESSSVWERLDRQTRTIQKYQAQNANLHRAALVNEEICDDFRAKNHALENRNNALSGEVTTLERKVKRLEVENGSLMSDVAEAREELEESPEQAQCCECINALTKVSEENAVLKSHLAGALQLIATSLANWTL